ncbi:glycoside hydrolase family 88 protein [Arachidicoccus soli]|uniref:Glucuronyl hydrolase n=1 Tax=Arachidicoccus soli TaxID=2341117 RepID=A0A386HV01_9BACT|nr:glycoside hydrolase family 88 protein [Arachidicoccus soli]AYD49376.1 glucuronyl hydrolase [Arachidicoccus soli]
MKNKLFFAIVLSQVLLLVSCNAQKVDVQNELEFCVQQANKTIAQIPNDSLFPRSISNGNANWDYVNKKDWTSGFWPGILWYLYQYTGDKYFELKADSTTTELTSVAYSPSFDHDLGFMLYNSFGNGYRLTKDSHYKKVLLAAADSLATLYNPKVGTILSWPSMVKKMNWPHNTIIDNMMNLELLFWAAKNGGGQKLYDIAVKHAETTMKNQFRPDYSNYHVVVYDTTTGKVIKRITHQGYSNSSMWARGQSWAIYGFTMVYRETHDKKFLDFAENVANVYLERLPKDLIPYWDFNAPNIPNAPRDASAAAVTASALLELSTYIVDKRVSEKYFNKAVRMLEELSSAKYQSREKNDAFLLHSTGNMPIQGEVDVPIIYADYYYIEALLRLKEIEKKHKLILE